MTKKTQEELVEARANFQKLMELAEHDPLGAVALEVPSFSLASFTRIEALAEATGLGGTPYIHFATFDKWIERGYCVQKGQKAVTSVVTFIVVEKDGEKKKRPWSSHLFHISQVAEL
jgi:hypothetical protein